MSLENDYSDVLHSIESAIADIYRKNEELKDTEASRALQQLIQYYNNRQRGIEAEEPDLPTNEAAIFRAVKAKLDLREDLMEENKEEETSGRKRFSRGLRQKKDTPIVGCLRKIDKSVNRHSKIHGKRGYLDFIVRYT